MSNIESTSSTDTKELYQANKAIIDKIVLTLYESIEAGTVKSGQIDGVKYSVRVPSTKKGKQQPVLLLSIELSDGNIFETVLKRNGNHDEDTPSIEYYFPQIIGQVENITLIERVNGVELEEYQKVVLDNGETENKLREFAFNTLIAFLEQGAKLTDIDFVDGHNIMFDPHSMKFLLFDLHCYGQLNVTLEQGFLEFIERQMKQASNFYHRVELVMFMIREFQRKYKGSRNLSFNGTKQKILVKGEPGYQELFDSIRKSMFITSTMLIPIGSMKTGEIDINPSLISAANNYDQDEFIKIYKQNKDSIYDFSRAN